MLITSCKKEPIDTSDDENPPQKVDSVYYINQIFEMHFNERPYIIDTTRLIIYQDSLVYPKYRVEILSIYEYRCEYMTCFACFGGFVYTDIKIINTYTQYLNTDSLSYPSCSDGFLSGSGIAYHPLIIDSVELDLLRVIPQPFEKEEHIELGYIPNEDYKVSLKLEKQ